MGKKFVGRAVLVLLLIMVLTLLNSSAQQNVPDQQNSIKDLLKSAIDLISFTLETAALASSAPTPRLLTNYSCVVLATIEGRTSGSPLLHPTCTASSLPEGMGIKSFVAQLKAKLEQAGGSDISLTFRNIQTYLNKASDLTKEALTKIASAEAKLDEAKTDMQVVLAFLSAVMGRPADAFSYGGLLTIQARAGK